MTRRAAHSNTANGPKLWLRCHFALPQLADSLCWCDRTQYYTFFIFYRSTAFVLFGFTMASSPNESAYPPPSQPNRSDHIFRHPEIQPSPWVNRSPLVEGSFSLALPTLTPGDLAEDPLLFERLQSPATFLPEAFTTSVSRAPSFAPYRPLQRRGVDLRYPRPLQDNPESVSTSARSPLSPTYTRESSFSSLVDLTDSSPQEMGGRKRKAVDGEAGLRSRKAQRTTSTIKHRDSLFELSDDDKDGSDQFDPVDLDDDTDRLQRQQQEDLIKQQQKEERNKPIRLANFNCIICMDSPTDLTITGCGKLNLYVSVIWPFANLRQDIYFVRNVSTRQ